MATLFGLVAAQRVANQSYYAESQAIRNHDYEVTKCYDQCLCSDCILAAE